MKPKIGLALGSGSARGWAHIGVLSELNAMGIYPDVISGTSIGALVAAAYAMDQLKALEDWVCGLTWKGMLGFFDIKLAGGGLILGERLINFFREQVGDMDIESLPLPFATVATELMTGREIWFQNGALFDAIRASMSLPGLFSPFLLNGRYLIDGGLVNPVPVSLCRAMGAEVVIAVNLNSDVVGKHFADSTFHETFVEKAIEAEAEKAEKNNRGWLDRLDQFISSFRNDGPKAPGLFDVLWTAINIMQDRITRSRMAGDPPEILIEPRLRHLALMEFDRGSEAVQAGRKSVELHAEALRYYIPSENEE